MRVYYQAEWDTFIENARRFDDNAPDKRYGIINPSANPPFTEEDMLYSSDVRELHYLHYDNYPSIVQRGFLDKIEVLEGKAPSGYSSLI